MWNAICRIILGRVRVGDQSTPSARTQGELSPFEFYMYMLLGSLTTRAGSSLTFVLCALVFYVRYRRVHLCNSWILALVLSSDDDELSSRCLLLLFAVFAVRICAPSCCFAATPRSRSRLGVHRPFSVACPVAAVILVVVATFAGSMFAGSMFSGSGCASVRCCVYKSDTSIVYVCKSVWS